MILRIDGYKIRYGLTYYKSIDDFDVNGYRYNVGLDGEIYQSDKWHSCNLYVRLKDKKHKESFIEISVPTLNKSTLENVDDLGILTKLTLNWVNRLLIRCYNFIYIFKIYLLMMYDWVTERKMNLLLILIAGFFGVVYFLINEWYDDYLKNLINDSNIIQSLIVFLSISSLINLFHPFTFRKELNIKDVSDVVDKRSKKDKRDKEFEEYAQSNRKWH